MRVGDVVAGRFELLGLAGEGGMGAVYRARDLAEGRLVALKLASGDGRRFAREAVVLAQLHHPGIVRYIASGRAADDDALFLAMEWLEGEDLAARLRRGALPVADAVVLARRIAAALVAAHEHGVVHRDLKPSNVFLVDGRIDRSTLLDFGLARSLGDADVTQTGRLLGTPAYMAPELARGSRRIDARADLFSLGCMLFEALSGRPPFTGEHAVAILAKILVEEAPPLAAADVPEPLARLVGELLAKDPDARPADAAAVLAAVDDLGPIAAGAMAAREAARPAITSAERRLLCVVLAAPPRGPAGGEAQGPRLAANLRELVAPLGARLEALAGGVLVAAIDGAGTAVDRAARGARVALTLRDRFPTARIAVATGSAAVGEGGSASAVIDRAAAMLTTPSDGPPPIRIDGFTAALLGAQFEVDRGDGGAVLHGERAEPAPPRLLGRPSPFVGRDRELAALLGFYDECAGEPMARPVLVTAPPGMGKSRLARELVIALRRRGYTPHIRIARGDASRAGSPFAMLAHTVRRACAIVEGEPLEQRRAKLLGRCARTVGADAARVSAFLGEMIGTPFAADDRGPNRASAASAGPKEVPNDREADRGPNRASAASAGPKEVPNDREADGSALAEARGDAERMGAEIRRAWIDWLAADCRTAPVVLVLDDLHWGDLSSVALLDAALRELAHQPMLVLCLARPEVHALFPRLWDGRGVQELRLGGLSPRACETLIRDVLGDDAAASALAARSEGNPFYLEELLRARAEGAGGDVPDTVLAMIQARLEGLPAEARRVLRAASVFGHVFWPAGVAALLGGADPDEVAGWVEELVRREAVLRKVESTLAGEPEYAFPHILVREAAYATLTETDRRLGHRLAAEWLEHAAGEGGSPASLHVLARHCEQAALPARARGYWLAAARRARDLYANDQALDSYQRAVAAGSEPADLEEVSGLLRTMGRLAEACAASERAIALYQARGDAEGEALALGARAALAYSQGDGPGILGWAERALARAREAGSRPATARALRNLGVAHEFAGRFPQATATYHELLELERDVADSAHRASVYNSLGEMARAAFRDREALEWYERFHAEWQQHHPGINSTYLTNAGAARAGLGDHAAAQALLDASIVEHQRTGDLHFLSEPYYYRGLGHLARGDHVRAAADALECRRLAVEHTAREMLALALRLTAQVAEAGPLEVDGAPVDAARCLRQSAEILHEAGKPVEEARSRWQLGRTLLRHGRRDEAAAELAEARRLFAACGVEAGVAAIDAEAAPE